MSHPVVLPLARGPHYWWGGRVGGLLGGLLLATALGAPAARAQRPAARKTPVPAVRKAPVVADTTHHQLSVQKTEEAIRLLLRADSVQRTRVQPGMEADAEGFVLDQTLTKQGRDFYELFYSTFQSNTGLREYTIVLSERPLRGTSSLISMNVNDTELLEMPLPTRTEQIEEAVLAAVETAREFLSEQQAQSTMMETPQTTGPPPVKP
ncbi:MAG: CsgE family curli-type amyloid fiber assembly protein [Janthinobacterium lividum]